MIGRRGERGSGISMLAARHDDDDIYVNKKPVLLHHHEIIHNFKFDVF